MLMWSITTRLLGIRRPYPELLGEIAHVVAAREEVPGLDEVAFGVLEVQRAVAALVLDGAAVPDAEPVEARGDLRQRARVDGVGMVDVAPALVAELLLARRPEPEPGLLPAREPDP